MKTENIDTIELEDFKILHFRSKPQRIEAKIVFDRNNISQKLIFTIMDIAHIHGFGCSAPLFYDSNDNSMVFFIGTILPSPKSLNKYLKKIRICLYSIANFAQEFTKQLDFSQLDLTMFNNMDVEFYPEQLAAIKDQYYNGSWQVFYDNMIAENKNDEAEIIKRCIKFENVNNKDISLVGHKLNNILDILNMSSEHNGNFELN